MQHNIALARHAEGAHLTAEAIIAALGAASVTLAGVRMISTSDSPRAALKQHVLRKATTTNVRLFSNIKDAEVYVNRVC